MPMSTKTGYKFLTSEMRSKNGDAEWTVGEWRKHDGELAMCQSGFHYCKEPIEAFEYIYGDNLVVVEVDTAKNVLLLKGAVPGAKGGILLIEKAL